MENIIYKYNNLEEALNDLQWVHISNENGPKNIEEGGQILKKYFDVDNLDTKYIPKIITENNTVIVFDNDDWNESYLIDVVSELVRNKIEKYNIKLVLITNIYVRLNVYKDSNFNPDRLLIDLEYRKEIEKSETTPSVITVNPEKQTIYWEVESRLGTIPNKHLHELLCTSFEENSEKNDNTK